MKCNRFSKKNNTSLLQMLGYFSGMQCHYPKTVSLHTHSGNTPANTNTTHLPLFPGANWCNIVGCVKPIVSFYLHKLLYLLILSICYSNHYVGCSLLALHFSIFLMYYPKHRAGQITDSAATVVRTRTHALLNLVYSKSKESV